MNSPVPSETPLYSSIDREPTSNSYSPSVPISVYRELAAELKSTKAKVEALTNQNQQLNLQNQVLRQEFLKFAQSAEQLKQAIETAQPISSPSSISESLISSSPENSPMPKPQSHPPQGSGTPSEGLAGLAARATRLVNTKPDASPANIKSPPNPEPLFTEQRPVASKSQKTSVNSQDMSGLWLATTILLIVVSAFGAGFLIMKPLLSNSR